MKLKRRLVINCTVLILLSIFAVITWQSSQGIITIEQVHGKTIDLATDEKIAGPEMIAFNIKDLSQNEESNYILTIILAQYDYGKLRSQQVILHDDQLYGQLSKYDEGYIQIKMSQGENDKHQINIQFLALDDERQEKIILEKQWVLLDQFDYQESRSFVKTTKLALNQGVSLVFFTDSLDIKRNEQIAVFNEVVEQKGNVMVIKLFVTQ